MGALTVNRKRCFVDIRSPSPFTLISDFSNIDGLVPKRFKFSSPSLSEVVEEEAKREKMKDVSDVPIVDQMRFPPPQLPVRRRIIGPQRNIRVFGIGNPDLKRDLWMEPVKIAATPKARNTTKSQTTTMRSLSSRMDKTLLIRSIWSSGRKGKLPVVDDSHDLDEKDGSFEHRSNGELELEDYKRLVEEVEGDVALRSSTSFPIMPKEIINEPKKQILEKNVELEKNDMVVDLTQVSEDVGLTNTLPSVPLYKGLLEETSRKYDTKLNDLMFEVKLTQEKLSKFHIPEVEKPKKELLAPFTPLTDEEEDEVKHALPQGFSPSSIRGYGMRIDGRSSGSIASGRGRYSPFAPAGYGMGLNIEACLNSNYVGNANFNNNNFSYGRGLNLNNLYNGDSSRFNTTSNNNGNHHHPIGYNGVANSPGSIVNSNPRNLWGLGNLNYNNATSGNSNNSSFVGSGIGNFGGFGNNGMNWGGSSSSIIDQGSGSGSGYGNGNIGYGTGEISYGLGGNNYSRNIGNGNNNPSYDASNTLYDDGVYADLCNDISWRTASSELEGSSPFDYGLTNVSSETATKASSGYNGGYTDRQPNRGVAT